MIVIMTGVAAAVMTVEEAVGIGKGLATGLVSKVRMRERGISSYVGEVMRAFSSTQRIS